MQTIEVLENGISVYQDDELYHFTSDAILLSKFAKVKNGDVVADFCSGSGVVGLNLFALNKDLIKSVTLFEMQKPLYDLSLKSIDFNNLQDKFCAINTKVQDIDKSFYGKFSLITCNPPYMAVEKGLLDSDESKAKCRTEVSLPLEELVRAISLCLKFSGRVNLVHRADRLVDVFCAFRKYGIEPKRLQFVSGGKKEPYLFLLEGVKGGKSSIKILNNIEN